METEQENAPPTDVAAPQEPAPGRLAVGERVEGHLAEVGAGGARLALPDGRTVSIALSEVSGEGLVDLGEPVSAFVVRVDSEGEIWVSRTKGSAALLLLLNARDHDHTVEGRVAAQGPRGLEIDLGGGIFAVCPPSEIGSDVDNPGHLVGQTISFKVKDASEAGVVLSRKEAAPSASPDAEARAEEAAEVRRRLRPSAIMAGRISRIREFGAFVDLGGGVEGLIHLSELAHERVTSPKEVVQPGQAVEVQVLKVDYDAHKGERISLSLKALTKSVWERASAELKEGQKLTGRVTRLQPFGAFVELSPGVSGLIHVSALGGKRHAPPGDLVAVGDEVQVEVLGVDQEKHRISLKRLLSEEETAERRQARAALREQKKAEARQKQEEARKKPHERLKPGDVIDAIVDRIEPYGFFLQIKGGGRGMVHVSEMGAPPEGTDSRKPLAEQFPKGAQIKVAVLEIDADHRIRLSRAAVPEMEKGTTPEVYLKHKSQHELEEKLLRSASKPLKPKAGPRRPAPDRRPAARGSEGTPRGPPGAQAGASERPARRERPPNQRSGGPARPEKSGGLGTLGDLLKAKLQQRKN
jgi:small subunit ribosomal protein S1